MATVAVQGRPAPQLDLTDERAHRRDIARVLKQVQTGQMNSNVIVTLDPSVATTTLIDARISIQTAVLLSPQTADAAAELPTLWIVPSNGQAVFHHTISAVADRKYIVALIG
jgi:hypothetical protein